MDKYEGDWVDSLTYKKAMKHHAINTGVSYDQKFDIEEERPGRLKRSEKFGIGETLTENEIINVKNLLKLDADEYQDEE